MDTPPSPGPLFTGGGGRGGGEAPAPLGQPLIRCPHTRRAAPRLGRAMHSVGKSWLLLAGFVLFYVIYLLFGALVFSSIERPLEDKLRRDMDALKDDFLNQSCVSAASLERFLSTVLSANKFGVSVLRNASGRSNWDLASSMFFANTLVTTVGESDSRRASPEGGGVEGGVVYARRTAELQFLQREVCWFSSTGADCEELNTSCTSALLKICIKMPASLNSTDSSELK